MPAQRPTRPAPAAQRAKHGRTAPAARPAKAVLRAEPPAAAQGQVQVPVQASAPVPAQAEARTRPAFDGLAAAHYATAAVPALLALLLAAGHEAMDRPTPDPGAAQQQYLLLAITGTVALAGMALLATRSGGRR